MNLDSWFIDAFARTRFGQLIGDGIAFVGQWVWLALPAAVILFGIFWSLRYISRGAGQYGIIEGYVGTIGAGKTTLAVQHSLMLARARKAVLLSNIPVVCGPQCWNPQTWDTAERGPRPDYEPVHEIEHNALPMTDKGLDLDALMAHAFRLRDTSQGLVLLMDEVGVIMPARMWKDFPVSLMWLLQQSRKLACEWVWTAQDPSFVDHQLRSLTAVVHYVRSYPPPSVWRRFKQKRPWLLVASAFTPMAAPRANGDGIRAERRIGRRVFRYKRRWELAFDTDGVVLPSSSMKGAQVIIDAVGKDRKAIRSEWGAGMGGDPDPLTVEEGD